MFVWFCPQLLPAPLLILRRIQLDTIINVCRYMKYPLFLSNSNHIWISSTDFQKKKTPPQIPNSMEIHPAVAQCSIWTNIRTVNQRHNEARPLFTILWTHKKMGEDKRWNPKHQHSQTLGLYYLCLHKFKKGKTIRMNECHYLFHLFLNLHGYTLERKYIPLLLYHYL